MFDVRLAEDRIQMYPDAVIWTFAVIKAALMTMRAIAVPLCNILRDAAWSRVMVKSAPNRTAKM